MSLLLKQRLQEVKDLDKEIYRVGKHLMEPGKVHFYTIDYLLVSILNRAISISNGYVSLMEANNFISAVALLRMQMDNMMRAYAANISELSLDDFALEVLKGTQINKLKDKDGKKMSDHLLRTKLEESVDWFSDIYKKTSGFVHFSNSHIFRSTELTDETNGTFSFTISPTDSLSTMEDKIGVTNRLIDITKILLDFIEEFGDEKRKWYQEVK